MKLIAISLLVYCVVFAHVTWAQQPSQNDDPCHADDVTDCASCLNVPGRLCAWCEAPGGANHCNLRSNYTNGWCANVTDPESHVDIIRNDTLGDTTQEQVGPQEFEIFLRRGEPVNLTITVYRAKQYPIDLYYLMDFSNSTNDDLQNLKQLASQLLREMRILTSNLQVGFGAFVDKPVWPYVNPDRQMNPCAPASCPSAFSFKNIRPLTDNDAEFQNALRAADTSSNVDAPEGLTDALMQVVVCRDQINWRRDALKLLVIATDDQFHTAGDGRLAGVYKPNDGLCHMSTDKDDPNSVYTMALQQDYPSISQIRSVLQTNRISPIFAITAPYLNLYQALQEQLLPVVSSLGELGSNADNVIGLIKRGYEEVASQVALDVNHPNIIHQVFIESCPKPIEGGGTVRCTGVNVTKTAVFKVEISFQECQDAPMEFEIQAIPFGSSKVTVHPLCKCDCAGYATLNASECNYHGKLECGTCKCDPGWRPPSCAEECIEDPKINECRENDGALSCSGHGTCICNKCECNQDSKGAELWFGKYCQCPRNPCDYAINQRQCGGPGRGSCQCNETDCTCECACEPGWKNVGDDQACDCSTDETDCKRTSESVVLCGGRGVCECGTCVCPKAWDDGGRCEECNEQICDFLCERDDRNVSSCVHCRMLGRGGHHNYTKEQCYSNATCPYVIKVIDKPKSMDNYKITIGNATYDTTRSCVYLDEDECELTYFVAVTDDDNLVEIHAIEADYRNCPKEVGSVPIIPIVIGIIAGIVGIGLLLLLLWWLLAKLRDYREFKAFERDQANAAWNQTTSPIYEPPNKQYMNPMYKKKKDKVLS